MGDQMRFNASLRKSLVLYGVGLVNRNQLKIGDLHTAFVLAISADLVFAQLNGSYLKVSVKGAPNKSIQIGSLIEIKITKTDPENIKAEFQSITKNQVQDQNQEMAQVVYNSVQEESKQDIIAAQDQRDQQEIDIEQVVSKKRQMNAVEQQIHDLETIAQIENQEDESDYQNSENDDDEEMEDSDEEAMRIIESKNYDEDDSDEEMKSEEEQGESDQEEQDDEDEEMESEQEDNSSDQVEKTQLVGKKALRAQITQEKEIRAKEAQMRSTKGSNPQSANDFERLLAADQDQSYLWIQYMAFMLDKLDVEAARKVVERGVKSIGITAESDKLNLWIAYMNLENQFGDQDSLQEVTKRALEVNDAKKVYLQLINIYRNSKKFDYVEPIFKKLCKKYFESLEIWSSYIEFLFEVPSDDNITKPKVILQKSLQALPKHLHINIISKYGMLEYKSGQPESGRTMFEGIVTNYPKRMDIWSIYMDMEAKYGGKNNIVQARHLFERCLSLAEIQKKPKKMKLVFRKYMEFENTYGTKQKLDALRQRVEEYLEKAFSKQAQNDSSSESSDEAAN